MVKPTVDSILKKYGGSRVEEVKRLSRELASAELIFSPLLPESHRGYCDAVMAFDLSQEVDGVETIAPIDTEKVWYAEASVSIHLAHAINQAIVPKVRTKMTRQEYLILLNSFCHPETPGRQYSRLFDKRGTVLDVSDARDKRFMVMVGANLITTRCCYLMTILLGQEKYRSPLKTLNDAYAAGHHLLGVGPNKILYVLTL